MLLHQIVLMIVQASVAMPMHVTVSIQWSSVAPSASRQVRALCFAGEHTAAIMAQTLCKEESGAVKGISPRRVSLLVGVLTSFSLDRRNDSEFLGGSRSAVAVFSRRRLATGVVLPRAHAVSIQQSQCIAPPSAPRWTGAIFSSTQAGFRRSAPSHAPHSDQHHAQVRVRPWPQRCWCLGLHDGFLRASAVHHRRQTFGVF